MKAMRVFSTEKLDAALRQRSLFVVDLCGLIKFTLLTEMVCAVEHIEILFIVCFLERLLCSTILALADGHALGDFQSASVHFTFEYCHDALLPFYRMNRKRIVLW